MHRAWEAVRFLAGCVLLVASVLACGSRPCPSALATIFLPGLLSVPCVSSEESPKPGPWRVQDLATASAWPMLAAAASA